REGVQIHKALQLIHLANLRIHLQLHLIFSDLKNLNSTRPSCVSVWAWAAPGDAKVSARERAQAEANRGAFMPMSP
ncbi:MAG: hypothetical protein QM676_15740, partial [Novosphingobium sp.]